MKYQSSNTGSIYLIQFNKINNICPECSHLRKKKSDKCLTYYKDTNRAYCFHCNTLFYEYKPYDKKEYVVPEWKNITELSDKAVKYFESRMIKQGTLNKMKVYSTNEWMPQFKKEVECVCFPYFIDGELRNIKFRGPNKSFKLVSGSELIFWNIDSLKNHTEIIITEGEIDALTFINNGYDNCISVPNGAGKSLEYLDNYIHLFDDIKIVYLATDQDTKGIELRDEFIRRLGAEKCRIVSFKECKDANEYFIKYGGLDFKDILKNSREPIVNGIHTVNSMQQELNDFFINGVQPGRTIEMSEIDKYVTWETGRIAIITGVPGSGKSEFVDFLVSKLNLLYGWKAAYFTPENYPLKYHYAKIFEKFVGNKFKKDTVTEIDYDIAYEHIKDNFFWILNEEDLTIDSILNNGKFLIKTKGIKILVIDPYNKIDHQYDKNITETQYISKFLDKLITFGKLNDILIFLVAHPRKMERQVIPSLYDISGSANFYNKTDYGLTVHRKYNERNLMTNEIEIHFQKIKFKHLGEQGVAELKYNYNNGRFETGVVDTWDNTNWLARDINNDFWNDIIIQSDKPF